LDFVLDCWIIVAVIYQYTTGIGLQGAAVAGASATWIQARLELRLRDGTEYENECCVALVQGMLNVVLLIDET
jgi:hypothetical protein